MTHYKNPERASDAMMRRMPAYYRQLVMLERLGFVDMSSKELARRMGLTDSQIRHDFNAFGGFGRRGRGYNVALLRRAIGDILDINREHELVIVGAGNIGRALAQYRGFGTAGFRVAALFDQDEALVGKKIAGVKVQSSSSITRYLAKHPTEIAVICTSTESAQAVVAPLVAGGVKGIWNFAAVDIVAPEEVVVNNVHLSDSLMMLSFRMHEQKVLSGEKKWVTGQDATV